MYQIQVKAEERGWDESGMRGVSMKVLYQNPSSGAMTVLTRLEAGASIPAHWHTTADETVFVITGDFVEDSVSYGPGSYFVGRAGTVHGPHSSTGGCTVLTHFSAEFDFQTGPAPSPKRDDSAAEKLPSWVCHSIPELRYRY